MLQKKSTYDEVYRSFHWQIPEYYNIGVDVCDKWADERYRLALIYEDEGGLLKHPSVVMSAVIGKPDKVRTEVVKAFVVLKAGVSGSEELAREIQEFVKTRLAAHEYPREIEFVAELPMTSTGKIIRGELRKEEIRRMEGATPCSR